MYLSMIADNYIVVSYQLVRFNEHKNALIAEVSNPNVHPLILIYLRYIPSYVLSYRAIITDGHRYWRDIITSPNSAGDIISLGTLDIVSMNLISRRDRQWLRGEIKRLLITDMG